MGIPLQLAELVGLILFVACGVTLSTLLGRKRAKALARVAQQMGFEFSEYGAELPSRVEEFHLFSRGRMPSITNALHGEARGIDVAVFDFEYTTGRWKNTHTVNQTGICFCSRRLTLPAFSLRPEDLFDKVGGAFGLQDIDFRDRPEFSSRYLLKGADEEAVRRAFTDQALAHFEGARGVSTEGAGGCLIYYRVNKRVKPKDVMSFLEEGFEVFTLFDAEQRPTA